MAELGCQFRMLPINPLEFSLLLHLGEQEPWFEAVSKLYYKRDLCTLLLVVYNIPTGLSAAQATPVTIAVTLLLVFDLVRRAKSNTRSIPEIVFTLRLGDCHGKT